MSEGRNEAVSRYWSCVAEGFNSRASHIRHGAMWKRVIAAAIGTETPRDLLDLGTGTGACAIIAAELGHRVTAIDGAGTMLAVASGIASERGLAIEFIHSQVEEAELDTAAFDIVTLRNVLWTVAAPARLLELARETLRPGGTIVVSDGDWSKAENRADYEPATASRLPKHAGITEAEARQMLADAGYGPARSLTSLFDTHPYEAMGSPPFFVLTATR